MSLVERSLRIRGAANNKRSLILFFAKKNRLAGPKIVQPVAVLRNLKINEHSSNFLRHNVYSFSGSLVLALYGSPKRDV